MENKEKVFDYINAKWIENNKQRFDINVTNVGNELNLSTMDIKNILEKIKIQLQNSNL